MSKIIAVANQKGGVGKTTTTVNLSACIAQAGKRVLCVDLDPQGNSTSGLGVDKEAPEYSIYDVLINDVAPAQAVVPTQIEGLDLLSSRKELSGAEVELVGALARETVLKRALDTLRSAYDYIFIDCPPSLSLLTLNALAAEQRRTAQRLAACWFLLTGACYHFSSPPIPRVCPLAAALREQFLQEQKWRRLCQRAAAEGDSTACGGLYDTLDGQAEHRMEAIRCLLEQMQPLPSGG